MRQQDLKVLSDIRLRSSICYARDSVENKPASSLVVYLVADGSCLTRRPKGSLRCLLVEVSWQIHEHWASTKLAIQQM